MSWTLKIQGVGEIARDRNKTREATDLGNFVKRDNSEKWLAQVVVLGDAKDSWETLAPWVQKNF